MENLAAQIMRGELPPHLINELRPEFVGVHALNPGLASNSPSRSTMMSSHISQHLVTEHMDIPLTVAGPEVEYSKYTTASRIPCDCTVFDTVDRYPRGMSENSLKFNPETLVFYCDENTGEYNYLVVPYHVSYHQYFGYKNVKSDAISRLTPGSFLKEGTVLADTPGNVGEFYTATTNLNVMLASDAGVAEDGIIVAREALPKLAYKIYEKRTASVGLKKFPVNIGGPDEYRCFPDIGEEVPISGELMYLREYVPGLAPVMMSRRATREVDYTFDEIVYARQGSVGKVVDIQVMGNADTIRALPTEMTAQFEKYRQAGIRFNKAILELEKRMIKDSRQRFGTEYPKINSNLQRLLVDARALTNHDEARMGKSLQLLMNRNVLDEYQIEFTIEYTVIPDIGYKLTSLSGDKGVITSILPRSRMPRDADGNIADVVMGPDGTVARTNYARGYLMYLGGAARDMTKRLYRMTGFDNKCSPDDIEYMDERQFNKTYDELVRYYRCIHPDFAQDMAELPDADRKLHLFECLEAGVVNFRDISCPKPLALAVMDLEAEFPQTFGPVTHQLIEDGVTETTIKAVRIAPLPIMLLDKTTDDTLVAATAAHGAFGVLTKHNQTDRYSKPWKDSPPRAQGESENRTYATHTMSPEMVAEMMDRSNNPAVQLEMVRQIVNSETPGNIADIVDRDKFPLGNPKPLELMHNFFQCYGVRFTYVPEDMREVIREDVNTVH